MRARVKPTATPRQRVWYYDRGIGVCPEWEDFAAFVRDMGPRPAGTTLDRIDNDRGYEPGNCRWATPAQQSRNRHGIQNVTIGPLTMCIQEWAEESGKSAHRIRRALLRGENSAQAVYG